MGGGGSTSQRRSIVVAEIESGTKKKKNNGQRKRGEEKKKRLLLLAFAREGGIQVQKKGRGPFISSTGRKRREQMSIHSCGAGQGKEIPFTFCKVRRIKGDPS